MKFTIPTQEFNFLLNKCMNIASGKSTYPILSHILIEATKGTETSKGKLTLTATDLVMKIECSTETKIVEGGATTLPAKRLMQLVREIKSPNIEFRTRANEVTELFADSSLFKIPGMSKSEFPVLPPVETEGKIVVLQKDLKEAFYRTSFAVSREDNRYALSGVSLEIQPDEMLLNG